MIVLVEFLYKFAKLILRETLLLIVELLHEGQENQLVFVSNIASFIEGVIQTTHYISK
jgi:hypothetical protein